MSQLEVAEKNVTTDTQRVSSAYVPTLQRTEGQPPPIAANGGLSYMSFDREGRSESTRLNSSHRMPSRMPSSA